MCGNRKTNSIKICVILALMPRGHRSNYLSLFDTPLTVAVNNVDRRGRNEALLEKRNLMLIHRHYFWFKIKEVQYQRGLDNLGDEFFLTERTIIDIVQNNTSLLRQLKAINPDKKYFEKKYPFFNWQ